MDESKDLISEKLSLASTGPGVYLMKNRKDEIIYVGKAKNLKRRLASYFQRTDAHTVKTGILVSHIVDFETILTGTENEALLLESTLIKKNSPRYNVILKDDKQYPFLRLDLAHEYPNFTVVRKIAKDGARYFGPFSSSGAVRETLKLVNKTFKLRTCKNTQMQTRSRPCLNYQIGVCLGVCCNAIDPGGYMKRVREAILVLQGKTPVLVRKLKKEMLRLAQNQEFEKAAETRDRLFALERTMESQVVVATDMVDRDVIGLAEAPGMGIFTLLRIRGGYLVGTRHFEIRETLADPGEQVETFLRQYYAKGGEIPREILIPEVPESREAVEAWLCEERGMRVHLFKPQRGEKVRLLERAAENAKNELKERLEVKQDDLELLEKLQKALHMDRLPNRIECFDNSNISGTNPVTGMVVFTEGRPDRAAYRRMKIRHVPEQDDYAYMEESLTRRYSKDPEETPYPDLLLVDGGKGQLNIAVSVLRELGVFGEFAVAGIAKMDEMKGETEDKIFLPGRSNPIRFPRDLQPLYLLMRVRDEAHKTAINFHRKQRSKSSVKSELDTVPGVGPKKKAALLKHFKSFRKLKEATPAEIAEVPGFSAKSATTFHAALHGTGAL